MHMKELQMTSHTRRMYMRCLGAGNLRDTPAHKVYYDSSWLEKPEAGYNAMSAVAVVRPWWWKPSMKAY